MKTIAVMSLKGGAGKSTLSVHLAAAATAARRRTLLVDMDPQRSSIDWASERGAQWPVVVEGRSGALFTTQCAAQRQALDDADLKEELPQPTFADRLRTLWQSSENERV